MKFEQVLKIYWSKGFYYNGSLKPYNLQLKTLCGSVGGFNHTLYKYFIYRFELQNALRGQDLDLLHTSTNFKAVINLILSELTSLKSPITNLVKLNLIRLFLIRSFRGKAQALGKPSRGQRTWSNAWTAYLHNTAVRRFLGQVRRMKAEQSKPEKINYKLVKKKVAKPRKVQGLVKEEKPKPNAWF